MAHQLTKAAQARSDRAEEKAEEQAAERRDQQSEDRAEDRAEAKALTVAQKESEAFQDKSPEFIAAVNWQKTRFHKTLDEAVKIVSAEKEWPIPAKAAVEVVDPNIEKEAKAVEGKSKEWVTFFEWERVRYGKSIDDAARIASEKEEQSKVETAKA